MTITRELLDELELKAKACQAEVEHDGSWFVPERGDQEWLLGPSTVTTSKTPRDRTPHYARVLVQANTNFPYKDLVAHIAANSPDVTLRLVAIARAALVWSEQRDIADENWPNMRSEASNEFEAAASLIAELRGTP